MSLQIPFGRYVLLERLARGGMAEIFLAKSKGEAGFEKTCVVKRVLPHLASSPEFEGMFLDEARLAARLNHPGIVQVFDLGREGEDYFFAMEYLAGEDLAAVLRESMLRQRPLPLGVALSVLAAAADALHYAHEFTTDSGRALGVVHRDVTPSNLFVTYAGTVKVLDFGVAHAESKVQQTQVGQMKGKAAYMAPEQLRGGKVDRRTDVWALGICLYELLTGHRPFRGDSTPEVALAVCEAPLPSLRALRPDVPASVEALVNATLERDLDRRIPSAAAFAQATRACLLELGAVPSLADYLTELFGVERREERLMRIRRNEAAGGPGTVPLSADAGLAARSFASSAHLTDGRMPTEHALLGVGVAPRRRSRGPLAAGVGALFAGLVMAGYFYFQHASRPVAVRPVVEAPTPVAAADVPRAAEETPPSDTDEPVKETPEAVMPPPVEKVTKPPRAARSHPRGSVGKLALSANVPVIGFVDGQRVGNLPVKLDLKPGPHSLRLENRDIGLSRTEKLDVRAGMDSYRVSLAQGKLTVDATPWADVFIDGTKAGQTPRADIALWEGRHEVRLVGPHGEKTLHVMVKPNQKSVVSEALPP